MPNTYDILGLALVGSTGATVLVAVTTMAAFWRSRGRLRRVALASEALSVRFAEHLTGRCDTATLRRALDGVPDAVFWFTLERFADGVSGEAWGGIADALRDLPVVTREATLLDHPDAWRRALAARHLGMLGDPLHADALRNTMIQGPTMVTLSAALALAQIGDVRALRWLVTHPDATNGQTRHRMVALVKRFGRGFVNELRQELRSRRAEGVIYLAAIECLGVWKDRPSRKLLEATLLVGGLEPRVAAGRALGRIGARASIPALCEALTDRAWQVRAQAARALGMIRLRAAVPHLERATSDSAWWVRRNAAYALATQGAAGMAALYRVSQLSRDPYAREMGIEVLQALLWEQHSPGGLSRVD